jgi:hypothetical protein
VWGDSTPIFVAMQHRSAGGAKTSQKEYQYYIDLMEF